MKKGAPSLPQAKVKDLQSMLFAMPNRDKAFMENLLK
jgi:hypothetical protein